jgi:hypothetical protein
MSTEQLVKLADKYAHFAVMEAKYATIHVSREAQNAFNRWSAKVHDASPLHTFTAGYDWGYGDAKLGSERMSHFNVPVGKNIETMSAKYAQTQPQDMSVKQLVKHADRMATKYGQATPAANDELQTLRATLGAVYQRMKVLEQRVYQLEQAKTPSKVQPVPLPPEVQPIAADVPHLQQRASKK